ncbi:U-scoloptoxin(01)-Cw1a [Daphnia magna]|uniref:U-scoloptoxin(01)-Cw1a n=1 Tax=Daphnia magna TaxID=35525 RepID=UPI001E1BD279|nr:U-scoloptoxin(01)-Cw1a [Daphnia magna]
MYQRRAFTCFVYIIGFIICDAKGDPQQDFSRPHHRPPQMTNTQAPIPPQGTLQVLGIPIVPALKLAGGIVGSVLAAHNQPEEPLRRPPFSCVGRVPGYYADVFTNCRNYYTCTPRGRQHYYHCGERTIFNQLHLTCDHRRNYDCRRAPQDYSVNEQYRPFRQRN